MIDAAQFSGSEFSLSLFIALSSYASGFFLVLQVRLVHSAGGRLGSPPFSRTLTRRPIKAMRSVHVEAKEV
ncbi:hypothetical protein, partial [Pseudoxanthomonas sangjuensis]